LAKRKSKWVKCPICGVKLKREKLAGHKKRVHPKGARTTAERRKIEGRRRSLSGGVKVTVVIVIIVVAILVSYYIITTRDFTRGNKVGDKPYNIALDDIDGFKFELDDHLGSEPVLMGFFSVTCPHCMDVAKIMQALYINYSDNIVVIAVIGGPQGGYTTPTLTDVRNWALEVGAEYPVLFDEDRDYFEKFVDIYVPWEYLVDGDGKISWKNEGAADYDELEKQILKVI
jgi:thiol-disulfide isomerase/thioredoxin